MTTKEELRAELGEASVELKRLSDERDEWRRARDTHEQNWLTAVARAEKAEAERDEARDIARKVPGLEFDLKAKANECEIADTEVVRLKEALEAAERVHAIDQERIAVALTRVRELERERESSGDWQALRDANNRTEAAESECAALRAEVERTAKQSAANFVRANTAESRLAAANALLGRVRERVDPYALGGILTRDINAHLANQPAAPATRQIRDLGSLYIADGLDEPAAPTRTEAEQRVLEAVFLRSYCEQEDGTLGGPSETYYSEAVAIFDAYRIARREQKR